MAFSWEKIKKRVIDLKVRRAKTMAKYSGNDFGIKHPAEARDAAKGLYTALTVRVTDEIKKAQMFALARREKLRVK